MPNVLEKIWRRQQERLAKLRGQSVLRGKLGAVLRTVRRQKRPHKEGGAR